MSGTPTPATEALVADFRKPDSSHRAIIFNIEDELLVPHSTSHIPLSDAFETDLKPLQTHLAKDTPAYIATRCPNGDTCLAIYSPDECHIKRRMLYAQFAKGVCALVGAGCSIHIASHADLAPQEIIAAIKNRVSAGSAAATAAEVARKELAEYSKDFSSGPPRAMATGNGSVTFAIDTTASSALDDLISSPAPTASAVVFLTVSLDKDNERVLATKPIATASGPTTRGSFLADAAADQSRNEPRFVVYRYTHEWDARDARPGMPCVEAGSGTAYIILYVCPDSASVRSRMVHASARSAVVAEVERLVAASGFQPCAAVAPRGGVSRVLESSEWSDVCDAFIDEGLHPRVVETLAAASSAAAAAPRPKRAGRGGARLTAE